MSSLVREGIGVSPGVALGTALVLEWGVGEVPRRTLAPSDTADELARVDEAIETVRRELLDVEQLAGREVGEGIAQIFDAQKMILEDHSFLDPIRERICEDLHSAEWAVQTVGVELQARFARIDDPYLRARGADIETLTTHLLRILLGQPSPRLDRLAEPVIVVAHDISPAQTATLDREHVLGFVTDAGGRTSHTAIMARSMEIPAIVGMHDATQHVRTGDRVILDGAKGLLIVRPDEATEGEYRSKRAAYRVREAELAAQREDEVVTPDGHTVTLHANLESALEIEAARRHGATGVGLFRSEFMYLRAGHGLPDEDAHFEEYRAVLEAVAPGAPVTIRTMDLGGDKNLPVVLGGGEHDSLLGLRGIRRSLADDDLFVPQVRGLLRASVHGNLRIVLPFITEVDEVVTARARILAIAAELRESGEPVSEDIPIGAMLEVPAATMIIEHLAEHVDFFSVGTNDLIQYLLAVDRTNDAVAYLYEPLHPGVLRILDYVATTARAHSVPLSLCGEVAADPLTAMVLLGLGFDELSMTPGSIPVIRSLVRRLPIAEAQRIAAHALTLPTAREVEEFALEQLMAHFPDGFSVAG